MKNKIISLLVAFAFSSGAIAADEKKEEEKKNEINPYALGIGVQGGLNVSNATSDVTGNSSNSVGFKVGAFLETPVLPGFLYIQPEVNFVQSGAENAHFGALATTRLNYLEFPLLAKVKFLVPSAAPFLVAGPSLSYLLSSSVNGVSVAQSRFSTFDVNFSFGGGLNLPLGEGLGSPDAFIGARYVFSLTSADSVQSWKSNGFQITLGLQI